MTGLGDPEASRHANDEGVGKAVDKTGEALQKTGDKLRGEDE